MPPSPSASMIPAASPQSTEPHLYDYLGVILRRRMTFALAFCFVFLGVTLYTFTMKPIYQAYTTLHIKESGRNSFLGPIGNLSDYNPVEAEMEILKSRTNAEQVVQRLHLNWHVSDQSKSLAFNLRDFASTASVPDYRITLTGADSFTVTDADDNPVGQGQSGLLMQGKGLTLLLDSLKGRAGDSFRLSLIPVTDLADALRGGIQATMVNKNNSIVKIAYDSTDPAYARDLVNTLVQVYREQAVSFRTEEASRTVGFLEDQLGKLRGELEAAEKNMQIYKSSSGLISLGSESADITSRVSGTETALAEVRFQQKQVEFAIAALKETLRKGGSYSLAMGNDPAVAAIAAKLSNLEVQKKVLLTTLGEAHPTVKALQAEIIEVQRNILSTYEDSLSNLSKKEGLIKQQLALYEDQFRKLPETERDLAGLTRISKVNSDMYSFLLQKHEESRVAKASTSSNVDIVDVAILPRKPIKPDVLRNLSLGFLVACMLGIALAFFQEYMDDTIKDAAEAKRLLGFPLLAIIPFIHSPKAKKEGEKQNGVSLFTQIEPKSQVAEAFRSLRTSLHFSAVNRDKKILLVTSTFPGEGKSIICANLANILSQTGSRLLIIDCDLRRSSLHTKFGHTKIPGLTELLTGDVEFSEIKHNTGIQGVDLLTAGTTPPNPSELLGSEAMRQFLLSQREHYDHILIDAPPVLAVTDAPVLTSIADMVIVVLEAGRVPIKAAQHMREMLAGVQAPVGGLVWNNKKAHGKEYGYYSGKYYRYGYGYGYGYGNGYGYYSDDDRKPKKKQPFWKKLKGKSKK